MANYTIKECLAIQGLNTEVKGYLEMLSESKLPNANSKVFTAANQTKLKEVLQNEFAKYNNSKQKREQIKQCHQIIDSLLKGTQKQKRLISAEELLPKLKEIKQQIESEKRFAKVDDLIAKIGMTKDELLAYLNGNQSDTITTETIMAD